jgi:hypothetical protein
VDAIAESWTSAVNLRIPQRARSRWALIRWAAFWYYLFMDFLSDWVVFTNVKIGWNRFFKF